MGEGQKMLYSYLLHTTSLMSPFSKLKDLQKCGPDFQNSFDFYGSKPLQRMMNYDLFIERLEKNSEKAVLAREFLIAFYLRVPFPNY